MRTHQVLREIS